MFRCNFNIAIYSNRYIISECQRPICLRLICPCIAAFSGIQTNGVLFGKCVILVKRNQQGNTGWNSILACRKRTIVHQNNDLVRTRASCIINSIFQIVKPNGRRDRIEFLLVIKSYKSTQRILTNRHFHLRRGFAYTENRKGLINKHRSKRYILFWCKF